MKSQPIEAFASNFASRKAGYAQQMRICNGGAFPDKTFYVIQRPNLWGIMTVMYTFLRYMDFALRRNWIPVIDMVNTQSLYLDEDARTAGANAWNYFFEQPCGYSLDDISNAKNVITSSHNVTLSNGYNSEYADVTNPKKLEYWQTLAHELIRFTPECLKFIDNMRSEVFGALSPNDVLGTYCRGTDYLRLKPKNHNVQPEPQIVIEKAKEILQNTGLSHVYLVTEDQEIKDMFSSEFGSDLLAPNVKRYKSQDSYIWEQDEMLSRSRILNGYEYLSSMQLLSECKGFVGGVTGGTAGMMLLRSGQFPIQYFYNLGHYQ